MGHYDGIENSKNKKDKLKVEMIKTIQAECTVWDSLVSATEWINKEGFDLTISGKNGGLQHISMTYSEFYLLKKMIKKLDR